MPRKNRDIVIKAIVFPKSRFGHNATPHQSPTVTASPQGEANTRYASYNLTSCAFVGADAFIPYKYTERHQYCRHQNRTAYIKPRIPSRYKVACGEERRKRERHDIGNNRPYKAVVNRSRVFSEVVYHIKHISYITASLSPERYRRGNQLTPV